MFSSDNLLKQEFNPKSPNQVWTTDFTYISIGPKRHVYLCTIIDLYSRKCIACKLSDMINAQLACDTLEIALIRYQDCVDVPGGIYAVDDIERGLAYIKSVYMEDDYIRLVSLNDDIDFEGNRLFPDILLPRDENTRIIGKVVAAFTPIEKEY